MLLVSYAPCAGWRSPTRRLGAGLWAEWQASHLCHALTLLFGVGDFRLRYTLEGLAVCMTSCTTMYDACLTNHAQMFAV